MILCLVRELQGSMGRVLTVAVAMAVGHPPLPSNLGLASPLCSEQGSAELTLEEVLQKCAEQLKSLTGLWWLVFLYLFR